MFPILEAIEYRTVNRHWQEISYQERNINKSKILKHLKRYFGNTNIYYRIIKNNISVETSI